MTRRSFASRACGAFAGALALLVPRAKREKARPQWRTRMWDFTLCGDCETSPGFVPDDGYAEIEFNPCAIGDQFFWHAKGQYSPVEGRTGLYRAPSRDGRAPTLPAAQAAAEAALEELRHVR